MYYTQKNMDDKKNSKKKGLKMNDLRKMILDLYSSNPKKSFNYKQVAGMLHLVKKAERQMVHVALYEMVDNWLLTEVVTGKFKAIHHDAYIIGVVDMTASGSAYVIPESGGTDVFVAQANLNQALDGDKVKVLLYALRKRHQPQGEVVEILKRKRETFVGTLEVSKNFAFLVTDRKILYQDIFIPLNKLNGGRDGQKAVARITDWPSNSKSPNGEIIDVLGEAGNNQTEMHAILAEYNLPYRYPE